MKVPTGIARVVLALGLLLQIYIRIYPYFRSGCQWPSGARHKLLAFGDPQITGYLEYQRLRKKIDILGNDRFLKQVASSTRNALQPEFIAVLGDLLSSQWIDTEEFHKRCDRFESIFPPGPGEILNITGNHDIGYHGEFSEEGIQRYIQRFGKLNFQVLNDGWRIVVCNTLSLDGPPYDQLYDDTYAFLDSIRGYQGATVLLLHVPMYKPVGVCRDGPHFLYDERGYLHGQNHLSQNATNYVMESAFGLNKSGIVLAGHDHEGCETSYIKDEASNWVPGPHGIPEHTVRSMMGEFGGNTGLVCAREVDGVLEWHFSLCRFHLQHIWWIAQVVTLVGCLLVLVDFLVRRLWRPKAKHE